MELNALSRVERSVRHAQTLSPARPASSVSRAVGNVSVHAASGFAADLETTDNALAQGVAVWEFERSRIAFSKGVSPEWRLVKASSF